MTSLDLTPAAFGLVGQASQHRIVVAMSGGVDSSLAAALVARGGYETVGITLQLYDHGAAIARKGACCAGQDIMDARRVADTLRIPHYVLNYEDRFRQAVIDEFADSYVAGETPIPCVRCNQSVKFVDLLSMARDLGASALVTGHYVQSRHGADGWELFAAADADRDQSYFLFATTQEQLNFLRFPLGGLTKADTRRLAGDFNLPVATKPDSQDICFVPHGNYADIVKKLRPESSLPGDIVHVDGRVLGKHDGVVHFTIGQRKGLGIATGEPLFVLKIDPSSRKVIVGPRDMLRIRRITLRDVNWLGSERLTDAIASRKTILVKVRSTQNPVPARFSPEACGVSLELLSAEYGVANGQACVFYDNSVPQSRILGGGFIAASEADTGGESPALSYGARSA